MGFFSSLSPLQIWCGICFVCAKFFGLMSIATLFVAQKYLWVTLSAASLWGGFLIATFVTGFIAQGQSKEKREKELLEKLKLKYEEPV